MELRNVKFGRRGTRRADGKWLGCDKDYGDVGMQWTDIEGYLSRTFMDSGGSGLPSPDVFLGLVFTALSFGIGWMASRSGSKRKLKAQVVDELIMSHSELKTRAYPTRWRENDMRETWMLEPFVARLKFLHATLHQSGGLKRSELDAIEYYVMRVEEFIERWAEVERRTERYHDMFSVAYHGLREAVRQIDDSQTRRLAGLGRPQDILFNGPLFMQPQQPVLDGNFVPAE